MGRWTARKEEGEVRSRRGAEDQEQEEGAWERVCDAASITLSESIR